MKMPYVIAHMVSSIDGKTVPKNWPNKGRIGPVFESVAEKIKADAWLVGRTTMEEFSSKRKPKLGPASRKIKKTDFIGKHSSKTYAVAIDPTGKCFWDSNMTDTEHVIEVLTKKVSTSYLAHLQDKQVSYIFAGEKELNLKVALRKLKKLFGIKTVRVDGGGSMWGSFLKASLINEISHVIMPVADGDSEVNTMFDDFEKKSGSTKGKVLKVKKVKQMAGNVVWIRYEVKN